MKPQLSALAMAALLGCGPAPVKPESKAPLKTTAQNGITNMAWDEKDLKCTQAEHDFLSSKMSGSGAAGWDPNTAPWKQIGTDFFFIPESISGSNGQPDVVILLAKQLLATMPP